KGGRFGDSPLPSVPPFFRLTRLNSTRFSLTATPCAVIFQCLMIWRRRCLVLVPVLSFLAAALIMSCGGGGSRSGTTTVANPFAIIGLNVCPGTPPVPTPMPSPTKSKTPTPTPTPECSPVAGLPAETVGTAPGSNTVQFQAQGIFG